MCFKLDSLIVDPPCELPYYCEGGNRVICMPQGEFTTLDAKAARHVGKRMTEVAAAQLFRDNGMNIWHGVTPSSMSAFFSASRSAMAPSWRVQFLTDTQSTAGQSGGELVGAHTAQNFMPGSTPQSGNPKTRGWCLFFTYCGPISGVEIWTQNWVHQFAQQLQSGRKA